MPSTSKKVLFSCGHVQQTHAQRHDENPGKKIWRMIRHKFSRSSTQTSPRICCQCTEDQDREQRMQRFVEHHNNPETPNPCRERRRHAPPAKGVTQTIALTLAEAPSTISALKSVQKKAEHLADKTKALTNEMPTKKQQELDEQARRDLERANHFWMEAHESHRQVIKFPPFDIPYSKHAGPNHCRLCREYRDALADPQYRQQTTLRDYFVPDAFNPEIQEDLDLPLELTPEPESEYEPVPTSRPSTRRGLREEDEEIEESGQDAADEDSEDEATLRMFGANDSIFSVADRTDSESSSIIGLGISLDTSGPRIDTVERSKPKAVTESIIAQVESYILRRPSQVQATPISFVDPADISLAGSPTARTRRRSLPNAESQPWFSHSSEPVRRLSLPEFWVSETFELPCSQSPLHPWQQTTVIEPNDAKVTLQEDEEFVEREREFRYNNEPVFHMVTLQSPISPDTPVWSSPPPDEPELIKFTAEEGCRILKQIKKYFEMPQTSTPFEILLACQKLGNLSEVFFRPPERPRLPPNVRCTPAQGQYPRNRKCLAIVKSAQDYNKRYEIDALSVKLDWSEVEESAGEVVAEEKSCWEEEDRDAGVEDAPKRAMRLIPTDLTLDEVHCYGQSRLAMHKVPWMKLSPLRNETVVEDEVSDDEEEYRLLEEPF